MFKFSEKFTKDFKQLLKKYHHIEEDFDLFLENFKNEHSHSIAIKRNLFKARIKNSDKAKGKSAGYRTYYYIIIDESVTFLTIYDKSEFEYIDEKLLDALITHL